MSQRGFSCLQVPFQARFSRPRLGQRRDLFGHVHDDADRLDRYTRRRVPFNNSVAGR